jgi:DNA mismatch repair protein MutS2
MAHGKSSGGSQGKTGRHREPLLHYDLTVDLHGYYVEDAERELDKIIDANEGCGILVIHGHGTGALKTELRKWLSSHNLVKEVLHGEDINIPGGDGVTVIRT